MSCKITATHCENCGNTNREDVDPFNPELQGYTGCCNELIAHSAQDCRNHHG